MLSHFPDLIYASPGLTSSLSNILHLPSPPLLSLVLHYSSLYSPSHVLALAVLSQEGAMQCRVDWTEALESSEQSRAWCLSRRQAVRNQNSSALQTSSPSVDLQSGFSASDFWERPQSSQRQPCGNSSGPVKAGASPDAVFWRHRMSNTEEEDEVRSQKLWTILVWKLF